VARRSGNLPNYLPDKETHMARKTTARLVQPKATVSVHIPATDTFETLRVGEAWYADDPVVKARPDLFEMGDEDAPVEEATAVPGDKRSTRRK
jgi:hypothetical protein